MLSFFKALEMTVLALSECVTYICIIDVRECGDSEVVCGHG